MVLFSLVQLMPEWQQDFLVQLLEQQKKSKRVQESADTSMLTKPPPGLDSKPPSPAKRALGVPQAIVKPSSAPPRVPSGPLSWRRNRDPEDSIEETAPVVLASPVPRRASILIHQDMENAFPGHYPQQTSTTPHYRSLPLTPAQPTPQQDDAYAVLFWSDLHSWLRCLRLHKYEHIFQKTDRQIFLTGLHLTWKVLAWLRWERGTSFCGCLNRSRSSRKVDGRHAQWIPLQIKQHLHS